MDSVYMTPTLMDTKSLSLIGSYETVGMSLPTWLEEDDSDDEDDEENIHRRACFECLRHAKVILSVKDAGLDAALLRDLHNNDEGKNKKNFGSKTNKNSDSDSSSEEENELNVVTDPSKHDEQDEEQIDAEETMGHVSFDLLPLLRKSVPGGDNTRLKERGVKHKWVKLVQTSKLL